MSYQYAGICKMVSGRALIGAALWMIFGATAFGKSPLDQGLALESAALSDHTLVPQNESGHPAAADALDLQGKLIYLAEKYAEMTHVPYVWGGGKIGDIATCNECRECASKKGVGLRSRMKACKACRSCGMDCSHFVNLMYNEAGLVYPYASSLELIRQSHRGLEEHYNLVNVGADLALAQPGDLLVYRRHIGMLVRKYSDTHGDFVHSTRFRPGDRRQVGGFRMDVNRDLKKYRGKLLKILRHRRFFDQPKNFS